MSDGFYDDEDEDKEEEDDRPSFKRARRSDPKTSKQATKGMDAASIRNRIVEVLEAEGRPMTAEEINRKVPIDGQSGNPRYNELMEEGRICSTGVPAKNQSGKNANQWRLTTPEEKAILVRFSGFGFASNDTLHEMYEADPDFDNFLQEMRWKTYIEYLKRYNKKLWDEAKTKDFAEFMREHEFRGGRMRKKRS
jgi:hypothetical protein